MSARAMAAGTVSFGLVAIPVKLYTTSESSSSVSFKWLHGKCGQRVRQQYFCPTDQEVVPRNELDKGYEFAKDQFVVFTEEEIKTLQAKPTHSIDITEFVPIEQVDPIFFEKSYYLGPSKGGERPYRLLAEAMKVTGRVAVARYAVRGKNYLVLLRPFENGLVMQQLRYHDEVRAFSEVPIGEAELKETELQLATQLVEQIANDHFDPGQYEDETRQKLWSLIEQKLEGKEITAAPLEEPKGQIIDLMEALKASLGGDAGGEGAEKAKRRPPKRAARSSSSGSGKKAAAGKTARARKK